MVGGEDTASFMYKSLQGKLPSCLNSIKVKHSPHNTCSQRYSRITSEVGKIAFSFFAPAKWNKLQEVFKLKVVSVDTFKCWMESFLFFSCF